MTRSAPPLEITVLRVGAGLAGLALLASALMAMLMSAGVLRSSPTRFAALAVAALSFVNWLVRLLLALADRRASA
jgi:hypothetical protein